MDWTLGEKRLTSRIFLGTARYPSPQIMRDAIQRSGAEVITVSLRREAAQQNQKQRFWDYLKDLNCNILPNTAGCHTVAEAITTAQLARELFQTHWIKLEVIGNDDTLQPDPFKTVEAARELIKQGFEVFPYTTADLIVAERLLEAGCRIIMPWGAPIGTGQGLRFRDSLRELRARLPNVPLVVDAGIGRPSHACEAMELGYDAVLVNTAVAKAGDPVAMAEAFAQAVRSGRQAYEAGYMEQRDHAEASTPTVGIPFWQQESSL